MSRRETDHGALGARRHAAARNLPTLEDRLTEPSEQPLGSTWRRRGELNYLLQHIDELTREEQTTLLAAMAAGVGAPPYRVWAVTHLPWGYNLDPPHLAALGEALEDLWEGKCDRLAVFMPPRHGKTMNGSIMFSLYWMLHAPGDTVLATSNTQRNAEGLIARKARNIAMHWGKVDKRKQGVEEWWMQNGSVMLARGVGAPPVGRGINLMVIDDPIKAAEEADSPTFRERAWEWYVTDLWQRLEPRARILMILTRWNEDDVAARALALEPDRWRVLRFPALATPGDPLGRPPGAALWPERYDETYWHAERDKYRLAGQERTWYALYQQDPRPALGDGYFDLEYLHALHGEAALALPPPLATRLPSGVELLQWATPPAPTPTAPTAPTAPDGPTEGEPPLPLLPPLPPGTELFIGVDVAAGITASGKHDYSTADVLALLPTGERRLVATYRGHPTPAGLAVDLQAMVSEEGEWPRAQLIVERNNHGLVVCDRLQAAGVRQYRHPIGTDSRGRAEEATQAGYPTTVKTKAIIDSALKDAYARAGALWRAGTHSALEAARETGAPILGGDGHYEELKHYIERPGGRREAAAGWHDDRVRSLALAYYMTLKHQPGAYLERPLPQVRYARGRTWTAARWHEPALGHAGLTMPPVEEEGLQPCRTARG